MTADDRIQRFRWPRLLEHQVNAVVFFTLVLTGMAQRFHSHDWSQVFIAAVGGIDDMRFLHRMFGLLFSYLLVQHMLVGAWLVAVRHQRPTMMINARDFIHAIENIRYYIGLRSKPARCDRYDYKQKFEYWGVIMGGILMVATGLMLWFPTKLFTWIPFLPGEVIPAAKVAHTNEAMMAFLIIVIWHIYNAVFSPEVFPFDTTILHGKVSRKRLRHEHPLELERIERLERAAGERAGGQD